MECILNSNYFNDFNCDIVYKIINDVNKYNKNN